VLLLREACSIKEKEQRLVGSESGSCDQIGPVTGFGEDKNVKSVQMTDTK